LKYLLLIFISFFVISCAENKDNQEIPDPTTYYLTYDETSTQIEGEVTFDMGSITSNHVVTLTNFTSTIEGCTLSTLSNIVSPDSLTFTSLETKQIATIDIELSEPCSTQTLKINADYEDTSIINGKVVNRTETRSYNYTVTKTTTISNFTPILQKSTLEIVTNKQNENVVVSVYDDKNRPATEGTISIIYPDEAKLVDVGSFSSVSVDVEEGQALFVYTAPTDIQTLLDKNITSTSFQFYYDDAIANYVELKVLFTPQSDQVIIKNYQISFQPQENNYKMSLEESKSFSVSIIDDSNLALDGADVLELNISLENSFLAKLINSNGDINSHFSFENINNVTLTLQSNTVSGLVPIVVNSSFIDINGEKNFLSETFNIIVESGPPTSISISYAGTELKEEAEVTAKFLEHFVVSVTDKYFNPVNTNPQVSVGAIVGYAKFTDDGLSANTNKRIYVNAAPLATLNGNTLSLNQDYIQSDNLIDLDNDTLVTFGNGFSYPASGGWSFDNYDTSHIYLSDGQYSGDTTTDLGFAIGRNHRQDACYFGDEWIGQAKLQSETSTIDDTGNAVIDFSYDYYLVGKKILIYINIIGKDNALDKELRIGEVYAHTLRGNGIVTGSDTTITAEDGATVTKRFYAWIDKTSLAYRNARFSFLDVSSSGKGNIMSVSRMPIESCESEGHAYVEYTIRADANETFSLSLQNPVIVSEF